MEGLFKCEEHLTNAKILILILIYRQLTLAEKDSHEHALKT